MRKRDVDEMFEVVDRQALMATMVDAVGAARSAVEITDEEATEQVLQFLAEQLADEEDFGDDED